MIVNVAKQCFTTFYNNFDSIYPSTEPIYLKVVDNPSIIRDPVSGVAFDGVDIAIFYLFDDADVIGLAVLAFAGTVPVKVDEVAGGRDVGDGFALGVGEGGLLPSVTADEPVYTGTAARGFGQGAILDVAALVGAPGDKAGAPLHAIRVAHVGPVGLAGIAHLGQGDGYQIAAAGTGAVDDVVPEAGVLV